MVAVKCAAAMGSLRNSSIFFFKRFSAVAAVVAPGFLVIGEAGAVTFTVALPEATPDKDCASA